VLEAAAAQLPVIATRVGGIPEIFGPTLQSLVPADDAAALRAAMQAALDDPAATKDEMEQRLAHISTHFALSTMTNGIEASYLSVLARG
jgi:glycosyltransferase involved in cell wall biosynthesis